MASGTVVRIIYLLHLCCVFNALPHDVWRPVITKRQLERNIISEMFQPGINLDCVVAGVGSDDVGQSGFPEAL